MTKWTFNAFYFIISALALQRRILLRRKIQYMSMAPSSSARGGSSSGGSLASKMYYLYILRSEIRPRHYIGITANVQNRLAEHNCGGVGSTKAYRPWQLIHTEVFPDKKPARLRELFLKKTAKAREELYQKLAPSSSLV